MYIVSLTLGHVLQAPHSAKGAEIKGQVRIIKIDGEIMQR